jgi:hypothetical protein
MKRLRVTLVLALTAALIAFAPAPRLDAQNAAKRPIDLGDILSFRSMAGSALSPNGQWFAYRLSPLQGDSEVVIRSTSGPQEWKFAVGEGGATAMFSADSAWAVVTISPTRSQAQANTRARRPNQNDVTLVNLANGDKTTIQKIQRAAFAGEAGGWVALPATARHRQRLRPGPRQRAGGAAERRPLRPMPRATHRRAGAI